MTIKYERRVALRADAYAQAVTNWLQKVYPTAQIEVIAKPALCVTETLKVSGVDPAEVDQVTRTARKIARKVFDAGMY